MRNITITLILIFILLANKGLAFDIEGFQKKLEQRHQYDAKTNPSIKKKIKQLEKVIQKECRYGVIYLELAKWETRTGSYERAEADFKKAMELSGGKETVLLDYLDYLDFRNQRREALAFATLLNKPESGFEVLYRLGLFYRKHNLELSDQLFEKASRRHPQRVDVLYELGLNALSSQNFEKAYLYFKRVNAQKPLHEQTLRFLILLSNIQNRNKESVAFAKQLAEETKNCDDLLNWVSVFSNNELSKELKACDFALAINPDCVGLLRRKAVLLENENLKQEALDVYAKILTIEKDTFALERYHALTRELNRKFIDVKNMGAEKSRVRFFSFSFVEAMNLNDVFLLKKESLRFKKAGLVSESELLEAKAFYLEGSYKSVSNLLKPLELVEINKKRNCFELLSKSCLKLGNGKEAIHFGMEWLEVDIFSKEAWYHYREALQQTPPRREELVYVEDVIKKLKFR